MKVYSLPEEVPAPVPDYRNKGWNEISKEYDEHQAQLEAWLRANGYDGKNTGGIFRAPVADGYAVYMLAEGSKSFLVHLPYGDAWHYNDVEFLPKREILKRINADKRMREAFAKA